MTAPAEAFTRPDPQRVALLVYSIGCYATGLLAFARSLHTPRALLALRSLAAGPRDDGRPDGSAPARPGWRAFAREYGQGLVFDEGTLFVFFFLMFYALEAWASYASPYYVYPQSFWLMLPTVPQADLPSWFQRLLPDLPDATEPCAALARSLIDRCRTIPVEVPLMEATIAYVALHTTRLVRARWFTRPFLAGTAVLLFDALLDPLVASSFDCGGTRLHSGVGLWWWFLEPHAMGSWLDIPLFNFGAWYAGGVIAVGLAILFASGARRLYAAVWRQAWEARAFEVPDLRSALVLAGIVAAAMVVRRLNPTASSGALTAVPGFVALLMASSGIAGFGLAGARCDNRPELALVAAPLFYLTYLAVILALDAELKHWTDGLQLALLWVVCAGFSVFPYWRRPWR